MSENRTSSENRTDESVYEEPGESGTQTAGSQNMRPPRRWRPGARWSIVFRCARAEYRLRPDPERVELVGYWLARALRLCPGIQLHAVSVPSNHGHLEVTDNGSEMSRFMACFLGPLAKDINYLDGLRGQFLERRFNATEIVDDGALIERIAYTVTNPVAAGLVKRHQDWPGLSCWFGSGAEAYTFRRFRRRAWDWACHVEGEVVPREPFYAFEVMELCGAQGVDEAATRAAIEAREHAVRKPHVLGPNTAQHVDPRGRPDRSKRETRPICHASTPEMWTSFLHGWKKFVQAYRDASQAFRDGAFDVSFPEYSYRPWVPLLE